MGYRRDGEKVVLEMTVDEYAQLLVMLGYALAAGFDERRLFDGLKLVNNLNAGNPRFIPYKIPSEG